MLGCSAACGGDGPLFAASVRAPTAPDAGAHVAPDIRSAPAVLDFGWVPPGRGRTRVVRWVGRDADVDHRIVGFRFVGPDAAAFSLVEPPPLPWRLSGQAGRRAPPFEVRVRVEPRRPGPVRAELHLDPETGRPASVALRADARGPPGLFFAPGSLTLGTSEPSAVLSIRNRGEAPLTVALDAPDWGGPRVRVPPPLALNAGEVADVRIDADDGPAGSWTGAVVLRTNAPGWDRTSIPLRVERAPAGPSTFTLDLLAEDRSDPVRLDPWRVAVALVGPGGARIAAAGADWSGPEGGRIEGSVRGDPARGHRIRGAGPLPPGRYRVEVTYVDDCRAAPTALVASVLGLGLEALLNAWLGGAPLPGAEALASAVERACLDRGGLDVALRVRLHGVDVAGPARRLEVRGDRWTPGWIGVGDGWVWEGAR